MCACVLSWFELDHAMDDSQRAWPGEVTRTSDFSIKSSFPEEPPMAPDRWAAI